ncbi:MAG: AAA family ATPase [Legionellaceae bacterium]|nr:AAA family ATPase [Legionellaceae bacterium]
MFLNMYQMLEQRADDQNALTAFALSLLLPIIHNKEQSELFRPLYIRLFGQKAIGENRLKNLRQELEAYPSNLSIKTLTSLINQYLRPRMSVHLQDNLDKFIACFPSQEAYHSRVKTLANPNQPCDTIDLQILSSVSKIAICDYTIEQVQNNLLLPGDLVETLGGGNCFFHALASELRRKEIDKTATHENLRERGIKYLENNRQFLNEYIEEDQIEKYLGDMRQDGTWAESSIIPALAAMLDVQLNILTISLTDGFTDATIIKYNQNAKLGIIGLELKSEHYSSLKLDDELFLSIIARNLPTSPYHALLKPRSVPGSRLPFIQMNSPEKSSKEEKKSKPKSSKPTPLMEKSQTQPEGIDPILVQSLMQQTLRETFTAIPNELGNVVSNVPKKVLNKTTATTITILQTTQTSELKLRGDDILNELPNMNSETSNVELKDLSSIGKDTSWFWWWIPTLLTVGVTGVSKVYADEYKKNIINASNLIQQKKYKTAADLLNIEFARWESTKSVQSMLLTPEHYLIGHLLNAICAERQQNLDKAVREYKQVIAIAQKNNKNLNAFMVEMHLIHLFLHNESDNSLKKLNLSTEKNNLVIDLNRHYSTAVGELYWKVQEQILELSKKYLTQDELSPTDISLANHFLNTDVLFILEHFADGRGQFFQIFCTFFQAATLVFFVQKNPGYLLEETKKKLFNDPEYRIKSLNVILEELANNKFAACIKNIIAFKKNHPQLTKDASISSAITFMETFFLNYFALSALQDKSKVVYNQIAAQLDCSHKADLLIKNKENALIFLNNLRQEFSLTCTTTTEWIHSLVTSDEDLQDISAKNGDNLLHRLLSLPETPKENENIKKAVQKLQSLKYQRNHQHKTPFYALKKSDPLQLKKLLMTKDESLSLNKIVKLLDKIKLKNKKPFILLSGLDLEGNKDEIAQNLQKLAFKVVHLRPHHDVFKYLNDNKPTNNISSRWQIIFIHNLELIASNNPNSAKFVTAFLDEIQNFANSQTIIVGATEYLYRCALSMIDFASDQHVDFPLPTRSSRLELLQDLLKEKQIAQASIERLADITLGYSSFRLKAFVECIELDNISDESISTHLKQSSNRIEKKYALEFSEAQLAMPAFLEQTNLDFLYTKNEDLKELLQDIRAPLLPSSLKHAFLSGATSPERKNIAKTLAQLSGYALIIIQLGKIEDNIAVFLQAIKFGKAMIFIDDMDKVAPNISFLNFYQTVIEETKDENIVFIAGADHITELASKVSHYFNHHISCEIPLVNRLEDAFATYSASYRFQLYADDSLANDMKRNAFQLNQEFNGLLMSQVNDLIQLMLQSIHQNKLTYSGNVCITLQDVIFFIQKMKQKKGTTPKNKSTAKEYITKRSRSIYLEKLTPAHVPIADVLKLPVLDKAQQEQKNQMISTEILARLKNDFDLDYLSIEAWLEALLQQPEWKDLISAKTGDTLLHLLMSMPYTDTELDERVEEVAALLKDKCYVRNLKDETPLALLISRDPHGFRTILTNPVIKTGDELTRVEAFLHKIQDNLNTESHLLLLDGPPGTGKTSTVISHIQSLGYTVHKWVRGDENDKFHNALIVRAQNFFNKAEVMSKSGNLQVLFMDEIDGIVPKVEGPAQNGQYNSQADVNAFQELITDLQGKSIVLIGATNYINRLPEAIISRAAENRISFPLPNEEQRNALLTHFFKEKIIKTEHIKALAKVAIGYSHRQLKSFADSFTKKQITIEMLKESFNRYARTLRDDFNKEFENTTLFMPSFDQSDELDGMFSFTPETEELFERLKRNISSDYCNHALLYGPAGTGKTKTIEIFAKKLGRVLIAIQADAETRQQKINDLFTRAKQFENVIIFFDEMDRIAGQGASLTSFLQTEMAGITTKTITIIGATNYYSRFTDEMLSRFGTKIEFQKPTAAQLNNSIKHILLHKIADYKGRIFFDQSLNNSLQENAIQLAEIAGELDLRQITTALSFFIEDLSYEPNNVNGITYLRLRDVWFSLLVKKIQEHLVAKPERPKTCRQYITENRNSLFPTIVPEHSVPASEVRNTVG